MATVQDSSIEKIVRPFQVTPIINLFPRDTPPVVIVDSESASESEPFDGLVFGESNDSQFNQTGVSGFKTSADKTLNETQRTTTKQRVKNPDDETQFVDVDVVQKITFFDPTSGGYTEQNLNQPSGGGAKVITVKPPVLDNP